MRMLLAIALAGPICACAKSGGDMPDAQQEPDASTVDMPPPPELKTLSETTSDTLEAGASIACLGSSSGTAANNYYRVFDLASFGITSAFTITRVSFQVEHCHEYAASAGCLVAVRVGTYDDAPGETLTPAAMSLLASNSSVLVPEVAEDLGPPPVTAGGTVDVPFSAAVRAGAKVFIEIDAPNGDGTYDLHLGANTAGESALGYILAPKCNKTVPSNISTITGTAKPVHLLMTVTGTY